MTPRLLVVTAVPAERDAVVRGLGGTAAEAPVPGGRVLLRTALADVLAAGVGPAAAAAGTEAALTAAEYRLVVSAGIAGGFQPGAPVGSVVVADVVVAADLGAEGPGASSRSPSWASAPPSTVRPDRCPAVSPTRSARGTGRS